MKYPKIVVLGGGSGLSSMIEGLKHYPIDLKAIVTVADDGGSSGIIRNSFNISPPGDLRRVILSMSSKENTFKDLLEYRFNADDNPFAKHPVGNIILTALCNMHNNSIIEATNHLSDILQVTGKIIPLCDKPIDLVATFEDGHTIVGEEAIANYNKKIKLLEAKPNNIVNPDAIEALKQADMIIYSPGSLYTSLLATLCYPSILETITKSNAIKVYVANIMTQKGETDNFKLSDHIKELAKYIGYNNLDVIIANNDFDIEPFITQKYLTKESSLVVADKDECKKLNVIMKYVKIIMIEDDYIRHDHFKIGALLFNLFVEMEV